MKLKEYIFNTESPTALNVLKELESKQTDVVILRDFLSAREIQELLSVNKPNSNWYTVYDGYDAFPRPFDHIPRNPLEDYEKECKNYITSINENQIASRFQEKLQTISTEYALDFNDASHNINDSQTWSSLRQLALGKGYFEIHCGRLFQDWNKNYFDKFARKAEIDTQFAFLIVLQRPETNCDIEIFDLTWDEASIKIDTNRLQKKNGEIIHIDQLKSEKVQLCEGDVLIFDEGNYWHLVPPFKGDQIRISFGGFMTKLLDNKNYLVWS
jgi:hypothetical protein